MPYKLKYSSRQVIKTSEDDDADTVVDVATKRRVADKIESINLRLQQRKFIDQNLAVVGATEVWVH